MGTQARDAVRNGEHPQTGVTNPRGGGAGQVANPPEGSERDRRKCGASSPTAQGKAHGWLWGAMRLSCILPATPPRGVKGLGEMRRVTHWQARCYRTMAAG
jgi:hypothetical protein